MSHVPISAQERREKADPYELETPIPLPILLLVATMVVFGMVYILATTPNQAPELGDSRTLADLGPKKPAPVASVGAAAVDGAATFTARCSACHQANGQGVPGVFPPLAGSEWANAKDVLVAKIVLHGIQGPLTVKGTKYNGAMPAFKDQLDDATLAAVTTYVRSHWGNASPAIAPTVVAAARTETAARTAPWNGDADLAAMK